MKDLKNVIGVIGLAKVKVAESKLSHVVINTGSGYEITLKEHFSGVPVAVVDYKEGKVVASTDELINDEKPKGKTAKSKSVSISSGKDNCTEC